MIKEVLKKNSQSIEKKVKSLLSGIGEVSKVVLEGPYVVVYTKDPGVFIRRNEVVVELAKTIRKKIIIHAKKPLLDEEEARRKILEIVPSNAEISNMIFKKETGEVYIIAKRTGYVVGKKGTNINRILETTGWRPVIIRAPSIRSTFFETLQSILIDQASTRSKKFRRAAARIYRPSLQIGEEITATFLGGAREVGRSSILIRTGKSSILLDAGIAVGGGDFFPRFDSPDFRLGEIDAIVITHAHLDHSGSVPLLLKHGYDSLIYATSPTRDLTALLLHDYINVAMRNGIIPFFSKADVTNFITQVFTLDYGETVDISPDVKLTLYNAGHILGSAMVYLNIDENKHTILYTGDFRYRESRLLDAAEDSIPRVDTIIMESTYGGEQDVFPPLEEAEERMISIIAKTLREGGKVLIPALSVGRSTEVMLALIDALEKEKLPDVPIFIDGMISDSNAIHTAYPVYLSKVIRDKIFEEDVNPFIEPHITPVKGPSDREEIVTGGPSVIIAPSGMLVGGPSLEYFSTLAPDEKNTILLVSYQAKGTLGRRLIEGAKQVSVPSPSGQREVEVRASVHLIEGFSAHADKVQLLSYLARLEPKPKRVILVHSEEKKLYTFSSLVHNTLRSAHTRVIVPDILERFRLT